MNRHIITAGLICLLASCSSVSVTGETAADSVLKNDVSRELKQIYRWTENCSRIMDIVTENKGTKVDAQGRVLEVNEIWTVYGCGKKKAYPIRMLPDAKGETDYHILVSPKSAEPVSQILKP